MAPPKITIPPLAIILTPLRSHLNASDFENVSQAQSAATKCGTILETTLLGKFNWTPWDIFSPLLPSWPP